MRTETRTVGQCGIFTICTMWPLNRICVHISDWCVFVWSSNDEKHSCFFPCLARMLRLMQSTSFHAKVSRTENHSVTGCHRSVCMYIVGTSYSVEPIDRNKFNFFFCFILNVQTARVVHAAHVQWSLWIHIAHVIPAAACQIDSYDFRDYNTFGRLAIGDNVKGNKVIKSPLILLATHAQPWCERTSCAAPIGNRPQHSRSHVAS